MLPAAGPGDSVAIVLDGLPDRVLDAADSWLTMRWTSAHDLAWAPAGYEVGVLQLPLGAGRATRVDPEPDRGASTESVVTADGTIVHPWLAGAPSLALWRAPTDNDRIGGLAAPGPCSGSTASTAGSSRSTGPGRPWRSSDRLTTARRDRDRAPTDGDRSAGQAAITVEEAVDIPPEIADLPRVGTVLETVAGLEQVTWFGTGPHETYPDRRRGGIVGAPPLDRHRPDRPYIRPQENGGHADVRWLALRDGAGRGLRIDLRPAAPGVGDPSSGRRTLRPRPTTAELVPRPGTVVHLDAAHRGLGTASCGPDTLPAVPRSARARTAGRGASSRRRRSR